MSCWLGESPYNCPECGGDCRVWYDDSDEEEDCDACGGTGWDASKIDLGAFRAAAEALRLPAWEWIEHGEGGRVRVGRTNGKGGVRAEDCLRKPS